MHFCARNCGIFFPTVNNMEMVKKLQPPRPCVRTLTGVPGGCHRAGIPWVPATGRARSGAGTRSRSRGVGAPARGAGGRGRFKGGRGGGSLLSPSRGRRVTWARGAAAIGPRHVSASAARDVTRGGSVKNKIQTQSESVSGRAKWPGGSRAGAGVSAARARAQRGSAGLQPGPARPPLLTHAARAAGLGGGGGGAAARRWGARARSGAAAERGAGPRASMCVRAAADVLTAGAPHPRGPARARGRGRPGGGGRSGPGRA